MFCGAEMVFSRRGDQRACIVMHDDRHMFATCTARVQHGNFPSLPEGCCRVAGRAQTLGGDTRKEQEDGSFCVLPSPAAGDSWWMALSKELEGMG